MHTACLPSEGPIRAEESCPDCGGDPFSEIARQVQQERGIKVRNPRSGLEGATRIPSSKVSPFRVWVVLKLSLAAFVMFALTAVFILNAITDPLSRQNTNGLSVRDFEIALYPFIGGIVASVALFLLARRWKRQASKKAAEIRSEVQIAPAEHVS
jgi:hypothetical protein